MRFLKLTLDTPAENLALDEALLAGAEAGEIADDVLRLWESKTYSVVLGRSSDASIEVNLPACREAAVPVLRRSSGGGTVVAGPGCLMFAVVLSLDRYPQLQAIDQAHDFVLERLATALTTLDLTIAPAGTSDLAVGLREGAPLQKFSGNAMRLKRRHILYHGTLLYDFDVQRIARLLAKPTRTPEYRGERQHENFVTNLPVEKQALVDRLIEGWSAHEALDTWPQARVAEIVQAKYSDNPKWNIYRPST